jgi:hypothetical protein
VRLRRSGLTVRPELLPAFSRPLNALSIGSYIGVFGSLPVGEGENIRVDFQVDENPVVTTVRVLDPDRSDDDVWFDAGPLDSKEHTLVIRYLGNDREFLFDYIEYEDTIITTSPNTTSSSNSPSSSTTTVVSHSTSSAASSGSTGVTPGALAGAVVGAVIGTAAITLLGLFLYNRRRRKRKLARAMSREPPMSAASGESSVLKAWRLRD